MKKIKVLRDARITYTKLFWNVAIEYDGKKYVIIVSEDNNGREETFYYYDEDRRHCVGEEVKDDDLIEELSERAIEALRAEGMFYSGLKEGYELEVDDE
jgi:hypothetical protein